MATVVSVLPCSAAKGKKNWLKEEGGHLRGWLSFQSNKVSRRNK